MKKEISPGIYIVVNPAQNKGEIISQLTQIRDLPIAAIQIWDNPDLENMDYSLLEVILKMFKDTVPVLINNQWKLLRNFDLDGVHFDKLPDQFITIEREINRDFIKGITLTNDLRVVGEAQRLNVDYLSFCAMFPSKTVDSCEIVNPETVIKCREMTDLPIFLSGGITPVNLQRLKNIPFQGIAVVSGIMNAARPADAFKSYELALKN